MEGTEVVNVNLSKERIDKQRELSRAPEIRHASTSDMRVNKCKVHKLGQICIFINSVSEPTREPDIDVFMAERTVILRKRERLF